MADHPLGGEVEQRAGMKCGACEQTPTVLVEWPGKRYCVTFCALLDDHSVYDQEKNHCESYTVSGGLWATTRHAAILNKREEGELESPLAYLKSWMSLTPMPWAKKDRE